ncbi:hypothetical protein PUNSTDRAFT_77731, partial [Punctularia strigosozonata HHB-11173 SS5]
NMLLSQFTTLIATDPLLMGTLSLSSLVLFIRLTTHLKSRLLWSCSASWSGAPLHLPPEIVQFLCRALHASEALVVRCWSVLRDQIWESADACGSHSDELLPIAGDLLDIFLRHGVDLGISAYEFYPRERGCLDPRCQVRCRVQMELAREIPMRVVVFTREWGALPAWSHSARCPRCLTRYYPTYYVVDRKVRVYHRGVPPFIHVATHVYIEQSVCRRFRDSMVCAWVSATNNARIYKLEHGARTSGCFPDDWPVRPSMTSELVWDSFFLCSLKDHHFEHQSQLIVDNDVSQADRLNTALRVRNLMMMGIGQEEWNHVCKLCMDFKEPNHIMRAVVIDGVQIGHPCCSVHDCKQPLVTQRARFCLVHDSQSKICAVVGCTASCEEPFKTCAISQHRALENDLLSRADVIMDIQPDGGAQDCSEKDEAGNTIPKARFGRRRTHNEQLCVATCGVILSRATFFGSEGIDGVRQFLHATFPTERSVPQVIFYDTACLLKKRLMTAQDHHFDRCALPVDVFHMKSKHKESDEFCGRYCNAAQFPDLIVGTKWRFNSSAAEMTNAWFDGFAAMVREMRDDRYDFFLDEMIKHHNRLVVHELVGRNANPHHIDRQVLLS